MKQYTAEETAKYKAERNKKLRDERYEKNNHEVIWDSKKSGTYKGSLRYDYTGKSRTNFK